MSITFWQWEKSTGKSLIWEGTLWKQHVYPVEKGSVRDLSLNLEAVALWRFFFPNVRRITSDYVEISIVRARVERLGGQLFFGGLFTFLLFMIGGRFAGIFQPLTQIIGIIGLALFLVGIGLLLVTNLSQKQRIVDSKVEE
jgi:hypothetical protein